MSPQRPEPGVPPGWRLEYLYVGTDDLPQDLEGYLEEGGRKLWHFRKPRKEICAVDPGRGPLVVLTDERESGSCMPMFSVPHLDVVGQALQVHGWETQGEPFDIPPGPCQVVRDPTGLEFAIFENVHPGVMDRAYADPANDAAVR